MSQGIQSLHSHVSLRQVPTAQCTFPAMRSWKSKNQCNTGRKGRWGGGRVQTVFLCPNTKVQRLHFCRTNRTTALVTICICRAGFRLSCCMSCGVSTTYMYVCFLSGMLRYWLKSVHWGGVGPMITWPNHTVGERGNIPPYPPSPAATQNNTYANKHLVPLTFLPGSF